MRSAVVLCGGWLALVVLQHVLSNRAYWWGPIDLLPPLVWAAVPVLLLPVALLARAVRWQLAGVTVLALLLGLNISGINWRGIFYTPPKAPADAIKVVAWNTEYWDQDRRHGEQQLTTTAQFYDYLRHFNADVYLLNEYAHVNDTLEDVFAQALQIDQEPQLRQTFPGYTIIVAGRDIILTRLPVVSHTWIDTTPYMPDEFKAVPPGLADRPLFYKTQSVRADIVVNGHVVSFYDTHLYQPPVRLLLLRSDKDRSMFTIDRFNVAIRQAAYKSIAADIRTNPNRVVMAGDFNTSSSMNILNMISDRLVDQTKALPSLYPVSWPVGTHPRLWRLDWLFTTPDVKVHSYDLVAPGGLSDHEAQQIVMSAH